MSSTTSIAAQSYRNLPRRRFSNEDKQQIVREFLDSGAALARFARQRDLHYNQLSRWRKEYLAGKFGPLSVSESCDQQWIPVKIEQSSRAVLAPTHVDVEQIKGKSPMPMGGILELGRLQISLAKGTLTLEGRCSAETLRTIIEALQ